MYSFRFINSTLDTTQRAESDSCLIISPAKTTEKEKIKEEMAKIRNNN